MGDPDAQGPQCGTMRASALPGKEPNCPCCAGTPYNLVPLRLTDNQRRLRSLGRAIGAPDHQQPHAAPAASSGKQIWGNEVDYEPVLLTHNEGPDAEPTSPMTKVHAGPDVPWSYASIRGDNNFQTPWFFVHSGLIEPGTGIGEHIHGNCEEIFFSMQEANFIHNGRKAHVVGPACVPCRTGESHGIYNPSDKPTRWWNFNVCFPNQTYDATDLAIGNGDGAEYPLESPDRIPVGRFDRNLLAAIAAPHGGQGTVNFREVWGSKDFRTSFQFVRHWLLPSGSSIGAFRRSLVEEVYAVISGSGSFNVEGVEIQVSEGDCVFAGLGEVRSLAADDGSELELFNVGVAVNGGINDEADATAVS